MQGCIDKCTSLGRAMKIVIFVDEARPGNPLRPDLGRATQSLYWCFTDWPEWLLRRADGWLTFGCVRSSIALRIRGGMSGFMKQVLLCFFHPTAPSFASTGAMLHRSATDAVIFKAPLAGLLGDEKGLKEVFSTKGPSSTVPCLSCKNIVNFLAHAVTEDSYLQGIDCHDSSRFDKATDADVYVRVDMVRDASTKTRRELELAEISTGIHYEPHGILYSNVCREFVRPVSGWLRDWMHMLAVSGCANVEIMQLCLALRSAGIEWAMLTGFFDTWKLPKAHGRIDRAWFTSARLGHRDDRDSFKGFSGELLSIVPILTAFLDFVVAPLGLLPRHIACFRLLDKLLKLVSLGADTSAIYVAEIERVIKAHSIAFKELYREHIKPKYHHLHHVVDHIHSVGKLLNCFVTERKHRMMKAAANHAFKNYETTVTYELLNRMVHLAEHDECIYSAEYLISPQPLDATRARVRLPVIDPLGDIAKSLQAMLHCGQIFKGDVVMTADRSVGSVVCFLSSGDTIVCILQRLMPTGDGKYVRAEASFAALSSDVLAPLIWGVDGDRVRVLPPPISAVW